MKIFTAIIEGDTESKELIHAIERYFKFVYGFSKIENIFSEIPSFSKAEDTYHSLQWLESFKKICERIEKVVKSGATYEWENLRNTFVIVDSYSIGTYERDFSDINILEKEKNYSNLLGMLILAFPEVRFIQITDLSCRYNYELLKIPIQLFDPEGIRDKQKGKIERNTSKNEGIKTFIYTKREKISYSIDDEKAYAYLSGYCAYKSKYRSYLIMTQTHMDKLSESDAKEEEDKLFKSDSKEEENINIVFEDIFINFIDRGNDKKGPKHFSDLCDRYEKYQKLGKVKRHIYLTVGHKNIPKIVLKKNKKYFVKRTNQILLKPIGGIYNVMEGSGLLKEYNRIKEKEKKELQNNIKKIKNLKEFPEDSGHSSPGRILSLAETLIERASKIFETSDKVEDCIHGATLALEAEELLNYKTPTTFLTVLSLRNKLEVKAECLFYGVTHHLEVKKRIKDLKKEIKLASLWFHPTVKSLSVYNALIGIVNELARIFETYGQFDEEMLCRKYLRDFIRRENLISYLRYRRKYPLFFLNLIFYPIRSYIEILVSSLNLFIVALISWPIILTTIVYKLHTLNVINLIPDLEGNIGFNLWCNTFLKVFVPFMNFNFFWEYKTVELSQGFFLIFLSSLGFIHLGIFISHLYTLIMRK